MYLKSQVFNLGETTNNRIESTFNKIIYQVFMLVFVCV